MGVVFYIMLDLVSNAGNRLGVWEEGGGGGGGGGRGEASQKGGGKGEAPRGRGGSHGAGGPAAGGGETSKKKSREGKNHCVKPGTPDTSYCLFLLYKKKINNHLVK